MTKKREYIHRLEEFALPDSSFLEGLLLMELTQSSDCIPAVRRIVKEEHFSDDTNRRLWKGILHQWDMSGKVDMVSVVESLPSPKRSEYVKYLTDSQFSYGVQLETHAAVLAETYAKRQVYLSSLRLIQETSSPDYHGDVLSEMEGQARDIRSNLTDTSTSVTLQEAFNRYAVQLEEEEKLAAQGRAIRVGTGFRTLDTILTGGFNKGELIILAARPSVGKTALLLQIAENASRTGYPSYIFSLEMTIEQLAKRMLLSKERLNVGEINRGLIDWEKFNQSFDDFNGVSIMIDDEPSNLDRITSVLTVAVQQGKCKMALIDYLQLIKLPNGSRDNMNNAIGEITASLKRLAKRLGIPIILLSQLSRSSVAENRPPQLHDLRDSGNIEQDADTVLMLERNDLPNDVRGIRVWIRKNRNGRAGDLSLGLVANSTFTRFNEYQE